MRKTTRLSLCLASLCLLLVPFIARSSDLTSQEAAQVIAAGLNARKTQAASTHFTLLDSSIPSAIQSLRVAPPDAQGTLNLFQEPRISVDAVSSITFPDKPTSYLFSLDNGSREPYVGLARINRVDITRLDRLSMNEYKAEFLIGYHMPSFGNVLFGRGLQFERPGNALLRFQDEGWRLKFLKQF